MKIRLNKIYTVNSDEKGDIDDDYVTKCMGSFGVWQAIYCAIASLTRVVAILNLLSIIFLTPSTEFSCVKFIGNVSIEVKNSTCYDDCIEYEYHQSVFDSTVISSFDLICEKAWLASFIQSFMMVGTLVGAWIYGWMSDRYGRRNTIRLILFLAVIFTLAAPFSPNYWTLSIIRVFIGMSCGGIFNLSIVYMLEIVGMQHRDITICYAILPNGFAEALLSLFAYLSNTWDIYLLEIWALSLVIFLLNLILPETPRWLVTAGKVDKAVDVVTSAAIRNQLDTTNIKDIITKAVENTKKSEQEAQRYNYTDLFRSKEIALRTICMFIIFFTAGLTYYGVTQYVTFMGTNLYTDVIFLGLIQVPMSFLPLLLMRFFGRKGSTMITFITTGFCMTALIFISKGHWACTVIGVIAISSITISFGVGDIYAAELFPTAVRSMAYGLIGVGTQLGAMSSPFIASLTPQWIPSVTLAVWSFFAALVCILLPETRGQNLKDALK